MNFVQLQLMTYDYFRFPELSRMMAKEFGAIVIDLEQVIIEAIKFSDSDAGNEARDLCRREVHNNGELLGNQSKDSCF